MESIEPPSSNHARSSLRRFLNSSCYQWMVSPFPINYKIISIEIISIFFLCHDTCHNAHCVFYYITFPATIISHYIFLSLRIDLVILRLGSRAWTVASFFFNTLAPADPHFRDCLDRRRRAEDGGGGIVGG